VVLFIFGLCLAQKLNPTVSLSKNPIESSRRDWFGTTGVVLSTVFTNAGASYGLPQPNLADEYGLPVSTDPSAGRFYFPTLTPPFGNRATYRYTLGRDAWAFEQLLTFANVSATIRCNVVKLKETGGLWVHSPQWPTGEFCSLLDSLDSPVEHIVLPCNAIEHKAPIKAFTKKYPKAKVWIAPGQYGPLGSCGKTLSEKCDMGYRVDGILSPGNPMPPWSNEFDISTLYIELPQNAGPVSEVAFCHRPTRTLVSTDAVVYIPSGAAPSIYSTYFDAKTTQDPAFWPRTVLQAVFLPLKTNADGEFPGFEALKDRLVRAPILRALADSRAPEAVRGWIQEQTNGAWDFDRIVTSHFASPIKASPSNVRAAFDYLFEKENSKLDSSLPTLTCQDWDLLDSINQFVENSNAGAPAVFDFKKGCIEK